MHRKQGKTKQKSNPDHFQSIRHFIRRFSTELLLSGVLVVVLGVTITQATNNPFINQPTPPEPTTTATPAPTPKPTIKPTTKPSPTPKPVEEPAVFPSVTIPATAPPMPQPTNSEDEKVGCIYDDKCGGKKETTVAECNNTLCCPIGGEYKIANINDCYEEQNRMLKEAYAKSLGESNKNAQDDYNKLIDEANTQANRIEEQQAEIDATREQLLQMCRDNVLQMYPESINGESPERRYKRSEALNICFNKYGQ